MRLKAFALISALAIAAAIRVPVHAGQSAAQKLPPLQYICTMPGDEDVLEDKPGICPNPKCKMQLVPVRLESKFWCPTHQLAMIKDAAGKCPIDGKDLVQVILNEFWTCPEEAGSRLTEPGKCGNGQPRKIVFEPRAHGDHNPRHDGQFFMAEDKWHHIEGTYPSAGLFRMYFYDNFTKPMNAKAFSGSIVVYDAKVQVDKELGTFPLTPGRDGTTMEGKIPAALAGVPLKAAAKMKFDAAKAPQRFDFTFNAFSKDTATPAAAPPAPRPATSTANTAPKPVAPRPAATPAAAAPKPASPPAAAPAPAAAAAPAAQAPLILDSPLQMPPGLAEALDESKLPNDVPGLLRELTARTQEVEKLVNEGSLAQVWLPAVGTKTVALILETRAKGLPDSQHMAASGAVKRVVTATWELDAYGDLGDRTKITDAYKRLSAAVTDLKAAYGSR